MTPHATERATPHVTHFRHVAALAALTLLGAALSGCETNPALAQAPAASSAPAVAAKAQLQFADLQVFDHELFAALHASLPDVNVAFYDRITPSALPDRLQKWMAAIEEGGGQVKITPPPSTVSAKSPFLLIGLANFAMNVSKVNKAAAAASQFKPAQAYNANIQLKVDDKGDTIIDKVLFTPRAK
jgi:hypothetical protein